MPVYRNYQNRKFTVDFNPARNDGMLMDMGKTAAVTDNVVHARENLDTKLDGLTALGASKTRTYDAATSQYTLHKTPTDTPVKNRFHVGGHFYGSCNGSISSINDTYGEVAPMKEVKRPVTISGERPTKMIVPYNVV